MEPDESQFGLSLNGVLRSPDGSGTEDISPSPDTGGNPVDQILRIAEMQTSPDAVAPKDFAAINPHDGHRDDTAYMLPALLAASQSQDGGTHRSGTGGGFYWAIVGGTGIIVIILLICGIYWRPLSDILVAARPVVSAPKTVAMIGSQPGAAPKPASNLPHPAVSSPAPPSPLAGNSGVQNRGVKGVNAKSGVVQPVVAATLPQGRVNPAAPLDLDHPFYQREKGALPPLFTTDSR